LNGEGEREIVIKHEFGSVRIWIKREFGSGVNLESGIIPLLASPQGGVAASLRKYRAATESDADGVVFL
jgi:hypothetical protein